MLGKTLDAALSPYLRFEGRMRIEFHITQRFFMLPIKYLHVQEQDDQGSLPIRFTT